MQYSVNGGAKTAVTTQDNEYVISVSVGDKVQFYGNGTSITSYSGTRFNDGTAEYYLYGNIMSPVYNSTQRTAFVYFLYNVTFLHHRKRDAFPQSGEYAEQG